MNVLAEFRRFHAEIMDFGYPQNLSPEILKLYITQEGVRSSFSSKVTCCSRLFFANWPIFRVLVYWYSQISKFMIFEDGSRLIRRCLFAGRG